MSIQLGGPSLLLNSYDFTDGFGGCGMSMDTTWNCPKTAKARDVANWIMVACNNAPEKKLANVVLNFHGEPGRVLVGEASEGKMLRSGNYIAETFHVIDKDNVSAFMPLRQAKIGTLWFHSCELAKSSVGKSFCSKLAVMAGCNVIAAEELQDEWWSIVNAVFMPNGHIDDYEGQVYIWDKYGNMTRFNPNGGNWK